MAADLSAEDADVFMGAEWDGHQMPADCVVSGYLREALIECISVATPGYVLRHGICPCLGVGQACEYTCPLSIKIV